MIPGEYFLEDDDIIANADRPVIALRVANTGDRPIQVGSHYHFVETNAALAANPARRVSLFRPLPSRDDAYGGTYRLISRVLGDWGIGNTPVDMADLDAVRALYDDYGRGMDGMRIPYDCRCFRAVVNDRPGDADHDPVDDDHTEFLRRFARDPLIGEVGQVEAEVVEHRRPAAAHLLPELVLPVGAGPESRGHR